MTWFWARIKKRTPCLGYPEGGFQFLTNKLVKKVKENGGQFYFGKEIRSFNEVEGKFDRIIFTTPVSIFLKTMKEKLPADYQKKLNQFKMMGSLNLILNLSEKFLKDGTYWLNVNQEGFPFVAVVDQSNFIDPKFYGKNYFLYVGGYYQQDHPFFNMNQEDLLKKFLPFLKKINPEFNQSWIKKSYLFKNIYSQPLFTLNYSQNIPSLKTPIKNVFLGSMQQIYPWDRGINYAIEMGEKLAKLANNEKN
jgi:protoporphyrinogen oxidase